MSQGKSEPSRWPVSIVQSGFAIDETGVVLGTFPLLAHDHDRPESAADCERLLALLSVAYRHPVGASVFAHLDAALAHWCRGDKALANLRLAYAGLPALDDADTAHRLRLADWLLDAGLTPRALMKALDLDTAVLERRYNPNQPRVPAGNGRDSGQWAAFWSGLTSWLAEPVPEYDQDTGDVVGTRSRGRAIATNPITLGIAGAAVLLGAEAFLSAAAATEVPAAAELESLSPFAQRYLSTSGGRLGSTETRQQLYEIAKEYVDSEKYIFFQGDGLGPEEFIAGSGRSGGTYVDFTAETVDGAKVRIQTIDTLSDGITPTAREANAATRIRSAHHDDKLILIPKCAK